MHPAGRQAMYRRPTLSDTHSTLWMATSRPALRSKGNLYVSLTIFRRVAGIIKDIILLPTSRKSLVFFLIGYQQPRPVEGGAVSHLAQRDSVQQQNKSIKVARHIKYIPKYAESQVSTIFIFPKGQQVWWSVTLKSVAFVYKIWIINRPDCCLPELPNLQVILRNNENSAIAADCEVYEWNAEKRRLLMCEPSIMATNVTILALEADSLSLCEVLITASGQNLVKKVFQ